MIYFSQLEGKELQSKYLVHSGVRVREVKQMGFEPALVGKEVK